MNIERRQKYSGQGSSSSKDILDVNLDAYTLDIMCKSLVTASQMIKRSQLVNLRNLIYRIDPANYINDSEKSKRVDFIKKAIEARLDFNLTDPYMILSHVNGGLLDNDGIIDLDKFKGLTNAEIAWMNEMVSEALKCSFAFNSVDQMLDICTRIKAADYTSKGAILKEFEGLVNKVQNDFRKSKNEDQTEEMFSLRDGYFENIMYDTYNTLSSPRRKLVTGMQGMNELLGGGFENGRVYVYFGLPGEGKSTIILNMIYQIKKYNKDYQTKDPTKRPCVVLLTMENTVTESIDRLFGMATAKNHMTDFSADNVIKMLREEGELYLTDDSPIDIIIKYKPSNSVDTSYLYTLTEDLEDQGLEVIAMFQDYIGRIRSTEQYQDTRLEYGAITDEFKTFSEMKDIPVITVAQLNRDASKHIDEARSKSQSDLVRLIGRSNISESMLILNNIDAGFLIAPETTQDNEKFLGIQRIKIRYDAGTMEFIYQPFSKDNTLKLIEDFNGIPIYKTSMKESLYPGGPKQSLYGTDVNEVVKVEDIKVLSSESSIFSTRAISNNMDTMTAAYKTNLGIKGFDPPVVKEKKELIDPFVFFDDWYEEEQKEKV